MLADIAHVSTPSISRFENGEKDIQMSTVMNILSALGMNDKRQLIFPEEQLRRGISPVAIVFTGSDHQRTIQCGITQEALNDHYHGLHHDPFNTFKKHRESIQHEARRKYLANKIELDGSILIKTTDMW